MAQVELFRLSFEDEFCCPSVKPIYALWASECVDVRSVFSDHDEVVQVPLYKSCLVFRPDGFFEALQLDFVFPWLFYGDVQPIIEIGGVRHATPLTPGHNGVIVQSGALCH